MKVLITGACGFIGRNLITELETRHELRLLDMTRPEDATMFQGAAPRAHVPLETRWPFVQAEITDEAAMVRACAGMDAVIHLAGEPRGLPEIAVHTFRSNALGTFVAIAAAQRSGVSRFLCASSINAFGTFFWRLSGKPAPYGSLPLDEAFEPVPEDPYSLSKLVNEETCAAYQRAYGITAIAFRFAGVWPQTRYAADTGRRSATHYRLVGRPVPVGACRRRRARHPAGAGSGPPDRLRGVHARGRRYPLPGTHHGAGPAVSPRPGTDAGYAPPGTRSPAGHRPGAAGVRLRPAIPAR